MSVGISVGGKKKIVCTHVRVCHRENLGMDTNGLKNLSYGFKIDLFFSFLYFMGTYLPIYFLFRSVVDFQRRCYFRCIFPRRDFTYLNPN